jgi:transposase-like protein
MQTTARQTRENRTITVDFQSEATYLQLLADGKAFVECVLAFLLALGLQLKHKATCRGGGCLTRHSHYLRIRLGGLTIWRLQCTTCKAVFTVLPHFVLRYRQMRPEVARNAILATHGGLSLELCAVISHISPMALYRLICAFGRHSLVTVLTRCGLPLPTYFLADEKHSRCLTDKVYLPTIVCGRVLWHLGYTEEASAAAFTQSYGEFRCAALQREPSYRVKGVLIDGFDSTTTSMRTLFPGVRLGYCLRHALLKLPKKLAAVTSLVRKALRTQFHTLWYRARQRTGWRMFALGQRLRHFVDHVTATAGPANGARVRRWVQDKKAGWYAVLADSQMPMTSTLLDQAHNAIERKLFAMKGFHHPRGSQQAFLTGLAHLYNLIPYQRRAKHASQCGVEVEGGTVPTRDWFLNVQILTSGGFR